MKFYTYIIIALLTFTLVLPSGLFAQSQHDWNKNQKEVWRTLEELTEVSAKREDVEKYLSYFHPEFFGWHIGMDAPTNKEQRGTALRNYFKNSKGPVSYKLTPLAVNVHGDIAIVQSRNVQIFAAKDGGTVTHTNKWTDIFKKENGKWLLISDHGPYN